MITIELETTCVNCSITEIERLTKGKKKCSYNRLIKLIMNYSLDLYYDLSLNLYNPYSSYAAKTKTHYILVHSSVEYFFRIKH